MKILIAEDDAVSRQALTKILSHWGFEALEAKNGLEAWEALRAPDSPRLAVLDWMMPGMDGLEVCRLVRSLDREDPVYIIMLTARAAKEDLVAGLRGGADDYITKPFDKEELRARLYVGQRMVELQCRLTERVRELEEAIANIRLLQGLLPICCYCKRIRDDGNYWRSVEAYITAHTEARFSHGICPECYEGVVKRQLQQRV
jgi:sigma-B regulation protein RsbU (phosphoserine phosphatase)